MNTHVIHETKQKQPCCSNSTCSINQGTIKRTGEKMGRNAICHCGSNKKFKKCCGK
ncbi:SEC-C metal-binding domain-containing protein [Marinicellulosiphila megalodicopiae]|uniref:SEC-C metal-binding domain-containing protein n=1 Tax=Marinicellulosiphila megalodicopiae TaxID=2724896 RepID=UPI003BB150F7